MSLSVRGIAVQMMGAVACGEQAATERQLKPFCGSSERAHDQGEELRFLKSSHGRPPYYVSRRLEDDLSGAVSEVVQQVLKKKGPEFLKRGPYKCSWKHLLDLVELRPALREAVEAFWRSRQPDIDPKQVRGCKVTLAKDWIGLETILKKNNKSVGAISSAHPLVLLTNASVVGGLILMSLRKRHSGDEKAMESFAVNRDRLRGSGAKGCQSVPAMSGRGELRHEGPEGEWFSSYYMAEEAYCDGRQWIHNLTVWVQKSLKSAANVADVGSERIVAQMPAVGRFLLMKTALELAKSVNQLHKRGTTHGDYKPENFLVMVQRRTVSGCEAGFPVVCVCDFDRAVHPDESYGEYNYGAYPFAHPEELACIAAWIEAMGKGGSDIEFGETANHPDAVEKARWRQKFEVFRFGMMLYRMMLYQVSLEGFVEGFADAFSIDGEVFFKRESYGRWLGVHRARVRQWTEGDGPWTSLREAEFCELLLQMIDPEGPSVTMKEVAAGMEGLLAPDIGDPAVDGF